MDVITQSELRDHVGAVMHRVEAGESLLVTIAGRVVAQLSPATGRRWVGGDDLAAVWGSPVPISMGEDLAGFEAGLLTPTTGEPVERKSRSCHRTRSRSAGRP